MSKFGVPTDEQLAKVNRLSPRILTKEETFVFSNSSAGDMLIPNRFTKLSPELLGVMVDDANHGVSFMFNHSWSDFGSKGVPYGKVFDGRVVNSDKEGQGVELYLDKYIVRDDEIVDGISANALIKRIETGILSDTSIGFGTDVMTCSICGMNYWGGKCSHWRGGKYEMTDGTVKTCYVTAMPPSIIIPYNNNALYEESICWDGAYPGARVTQSKHGDIVETQSGNFIIVEDKEELPENTLFFGRYHAGNIVTMVKKSDHKKIYNLGGISREEEPENIGVIHGNALKKVLKGVVGQMDEKLQNMLMSLGFTKEEAEALDVSDVTKALNTMAEKWEALPPIEPKSHEEYLSQDKAKEVLGVELSADTVLKLAKEGQEYHKSLSDEAIAMGVRAMGNDFPAETWKKSFEVMGTNNIKDIMKTWELQANTSIPAGRKTDPAAGQVQTQSLPDEAFKI